VKRRLRHLVRDRLAALPEAGSVVVRALPAAAGAKSAELGGDLDRCLARVLGAAKEVTA
jgi:ribonuclease P protein component